MTRGRSSARGNGEPKAYLVDGSLNLENFQDDGIPSISEIPYYEVDVTGQSGSGGVRNYSTNHPVIREITRNLRTSHTEICSVIKAEPAPENSEAKALLAKIVARYRHTSLAKKLTNDPPVRGTHGMADIQLVLGASSGSSGRTTWSANEKPQSTNS